MTAKGTIVMVHTNTAIDGETEIAAIVTRIYEDGTLNAQLFLPNGGREGQTMTGLRPKAEIDALPDDDADKNLPSWYALPEPA